MAFPLGRLTLLLLAFASFAQQNQAAGPQLDWIKLLDPDTPAREVFAYTAASDSTGNIYVGSGPDMGLVKFSPSGNVIWNFGVRPADFGSALISIKSVFVDSSGNVHAGGDFWGPLKLGAFNNSNSGSGGFYAKFSPDGTNTTAKLFNGLYAEDHPMTPIPNGGFVFGGRFGNQVTYEGVTLSGNQDGAVFKLNPDASPGWARRLVGNSDDFVDSVASSASGNIFLAGSSYSTSIGIGGVTSPLSGGRTLFLVSLDSGGMGMWIKTVQSSENGDPYGSETTAVTSSLTSDSVFWAGDFIGSMTLGSPSLPSVGKKDIFLAKLAHDGTVEWVRQIGGPGDDFATSVASDLEGNVYLCGHFSSQVTIGAQTFVSKGNDDLFVAKYRSDGTVLWAKQFGSGGRDRNISVSLTRFGELLVVGTIGGGMSFEGKYIEGSGPTDGFIAKFRPEGQAPAFLKNPESQVASAGTTVVLHAEATGGANLQYKWWFNDAELPNETNTVLSLSDFQSSKAGRYYVTANNLVGQAKSETAAISFTDASTLLLTVHPSLTIFGTIGKTYRVEFTSGLAGGGAWTTATNITLSATPEIWIDPTAAINEKRIYRVVLQP